MNSTIMEVNSCGFELPQTKPILTSDPYITANNSIQNAGVQYIYDSVLEELWKDKQKKFVSVEMEFFSHWWKEQDNHTRQRIRKVVER